MISKRFILIATIALVGIVAVLVGYIVTTGKSSVSPSAIAQPSTPTSSTSTAITSASQPTASVSGSQVSSADTSTWKTYLNQEHGFELKVPREWNEIVDKSGNLSSDNVYILGTCNPLVLGMFDEKYVFRDRTNGADMISVKVADFAQRSSISVTGDGLGIWVLYIPILERVLNGETTLINDVSDSTYFVDENHLLSQRTELAGYWAFYTSNTDKY